MINGLIAWCARNSFFVLIGAIFLAVAGVVAVREVKLDAIPDLSDVQVIVFTEWPGRAPTLVEDQVTYPIVSALAAAPKVKYARGQTFFGLSFVNVIFEDGTDMYWARSRVLEYMNQAKANLPAEANPVLGPDATGVGWVYEYALVDETGQNSLADLRSYQDWTLRYYLQNTPGVAEVASIGGYVNGYQIEIDPDKLLGYNIALGKVIGAVRKSNNDVGGRVIEFGETEYMVRGEGYIKSLDDIRSIVIGLDDQGTPVTVGQVANVHRGPDIRRGLLDVDGKGEAVGGIVVMRYGENALKTIDAVKEKLEAIKPALPPGVKIVTGYDRSSLILSAIANLRSTLVEEMIVVSLVIFIFLFHFRSALVAIIALPLAVLFSFIPMTLLGVSSNIMSLGGIAIAIGAMVDASVVLIENTHKWLRRWEQARSLKDPDPLDRELAAMGRTEVVIKSAQQVGKPLFFSLLVIAVSFLPVFALQAQSGRLFKPLAFTKTFAMGFAAVLSITLVPLLLMLFIRGKIPDENRNPVNRFLIWIYRPFVAFALRFRWAVIGIALLTLLLTWFPYLRIGSEFMPPLNEGSLLYMPTSPPGMAISESREILQRQDAIIAQLPEVERVFGKIGRARSATDPAPLSMVETVITLKPQEEWRPGMTFDKIKEELSKELPFPGMPTIWWMPIQTRIEMLATGIRSQIGIKVLGPNLTEIQKIGEQIEKLLKAAPNTASVFAERVTGGYYLDFKVNRQAIARHGLTVDDVNEVIETAIGGKNISFTVEGQQRFPINVRYARDFRSDLPALRRVLVTTPMGAQIPVGQLADIQIATGPPMVRNENGTKAGFVFVETFGTDLGSYVARAKKLIADNIALPPGYFLDWGGQFQYMLKARETLKLIIPVTLILIFLLIYIEFRSVPETLIILLSIPFALVGGVWLLWTLDYNFSVAVAVGFIALAGVAAETGVVMIVYLDEAWAEVKRRAARPSARDLTAAIMEGAVARVRPKMMTVSTTIIGLLPVMWSVGSGSQAMKRIAAPMVGGMVSSTILTLIIIPAIYSLWRSREVKAAAPPGEEETPDSTFGTRHSAFARAPAETAPAERGGLGKWLGALVLCAVLVAGWFVWQGGGFGEGKLLERILTEQVGSYNVEVFSKKPQLTVGDNPLRIEVKETSTSKALDVGVVTLTLNMDMPGMQMQADGVLQKGERPGIYTGTIKIGMAGEWIGRIGFEGSHGTEQKAIRIEVKQ